MQAAQALRATGANVVDFGAGEPDFDTPENIKRAAAEAMRAGKTKYTPTAGTRELQEAIIDFYTREFGAHYERTEVMATSGGKQALFNAIVSLIDPGDEVLIPKPYWVTFPEIVVFAGGTPVFIETEEKGFLLTAELIARAITPRTKAILLNSPCNPSGRVIQPAEFRRIMELLTARGIYAVSDECYLRFVYPPCQVFSGASLPAELRAEILVAPPGRLPGVACGLDLGRLQTRHGCRFAHTPKGGCPMRRRSRLGLGLAVALTSCAVVAASASEPALTTSHWTCTKRALRRR